MKQAISYIRFSSAQQGKGTSTQRQREMVQEWLSRNPDYVESDLSASDEGRSGYTGEHLKHGLGQIKAAIELGKIKAGDVLLVESLDRLGRLGLMEMIQLVGDILRTGVELVTLEDQQIYTTESANNNLLYLLVGKTQGAHQYSKNLGRRVASAYESKRISARAGVKINKASPWWIDSKTMELKEPQATVVKQAIKLYLSGEGTRSVLIKLKADYPGLLENTHPSRFVRWFRSRALLGDWVTKGETINNVYKPLIELSVYNDLQSALERRTIKPGPEEKYLLSGLILCKACNKPFHFRRQKPKETKLAPLDSLAYKLKPIIIYANCKDYLQRGACNNNSTWPYEVLEFIFKQCVMECLIEIAEGRALSNKDVELNQLQALKVDLERKRIIANNRIDIDDSQLSFDKLKAVVDELKQVEQKIKVLELSVGIKKKAHKLKTVRVRNPDYWRQTPSALHSSTQSEVNELSKLDDLQLREILKKYQFKIWINKKDATCSYDQRGTYRLMQRKQKFACYVIEYTEPEYKIIDKDGAVISYEAPQMLYYAVGKSGLLDTAYALEELEEKLGSVSA